MKVIMNCPVIIYFGLVLLAKRAFSQNRKELKMALIDEKKAPLVAMLNMTDVSENIKDYVDETLKNSLSKLIKEIAKNVIHTKDLARNNSATNKPRLEPNALDIEDALQAVEILSEQIRNLKKKLNAFSEMKNQSKAMIPTPVAFTAILSKSVTLGDEQVIRYDDVITNVGNAYHAVTGIFLVPVSGIYSLSVSMMGQPSNSIHIQLMRNGAEIVRLYTQTQRYELASQTVNIQLLKNDRVWVQRRTGTGSDIYGIEKYNVFSGVLIYVT